MVICLETATNICSVALCDSAGVRYLKESSDTKSHSSLLTVYIEEVLGEAGIRIRDLEAIAVSRGPGSYTGLRIGVSVAKGIAYALSIPLIAVDTTLSMLWGILANWDNVTDLPSENTTLFCPMIDARRQEVYYALYDSNGSAVRPVRAEIINSDTFSDIPVSTKIIIFGDGAEKCKELIKRDNVVFQTDFRISAAYMHMPVIQALKENRYEDVAYFEPFYLKDFITTKPRKNILGI